MLVVISFRNCDTSRYILTRVRAPNSVGLSLSQKKSVSKKRTRKKTTINLAGGAEPPQTPPRQAGGAEPPQTPPRQAGGALPPQTPLLKLKISAGIFLAEKCSAENFSAEKISAEKIFGRSCIGEAAFRGGVQEGGGSLPRLENSSKTD